MSQRTAPRSPSGWLEESERGNDFWLRMATGCYRVFGRGLTRLLLYPVAAYFFLAASGARRASRDYLETLYRTSDGAAALGHRPTRRDQYHHILSFARSLCDRVGLLLGDRRSIRFDYRGDEYLRELVENQRGGILLGSHVGSFDMLRALASENQVKINIVMYTRHAQRINRVLKELDPRVDVNVISIDQQPFGAVFEIRSCLERGELVGILGDRPFPGAPDREIKFLGRPALFTTSPFELATLLGAPILMTTGIRVSPGHYEVVAEPLYAGARVARAERQRVVDRLMGEFATRLERWCCRAPYQWYNFFDFWKSKR